MDPRDRADAILAKARARGAYVITPESAISPMDAAATVQIPRAVVSAADAADPDVTLVFAPARPQDELPAIAQEATTQSLASPGRPQRRPPAPQPEPEHLDGLVPTTKHPPSAHRPTMAQRLDGGPAR